MTITVAYLTAEKPARGSARVRLRGKKWSGYFWHGGKPHERVLKATDRAAAQAEIDSIRSAVVFGVADAEGHAAVLALAALVAPEYSGVYAIRDQRGFVKIGRARNIKKRLRQLQGANSEPIALVAVLSRLETAERWYQKKLKNSGFVRGEWFAPTSRVLEVISQGRARF